MNTRPKSITVIGIGVSPRHLTEYSLQPLQHADLVIGSLRQLGYIPHLDCATLPYPKPMDELLPLLDQLLHHGPHRNIVLLASGDPLFHGIGSWLLKKMPLMPQVKLRCLPNITSIQYAAALLGQSWDKLEVIHLHGENIAQLRARILNGHYYGLLTDAQNTPQAIAQELLQMGYDQSQCWIMEAMGTTDEQVTQLSAASLSQCSHPFHSFNVLFIEVKGAHSPWPQFPGAADSWFSVEETDSAMYTKREIRLAILSLLQPQAQHIGWDVGAGFGSVALEWARWNPLGQVYAIEKRAARYAILLKHQQRWGVSKNLIAIQGCAPEIFINLPQPQRIFVGGGGADLKPILSAAWEKLSSPGRMVISVVTEHGKQVLYDFCQEKYPEWLEIQVSKPHALGTQWVLKPQLPVTLVGLEK